MKKSIIAAGAASVALAAMPIVGAFADTAVNDIITATLTPGCTVTDSLTKNVNVTLTPGNLTTTPAATSVSVTCNSDSWTVTAVGASATATWTPEGTSEEHTSAVSSLLADNGTGDDHDYVEIVTGLGTGGATSNWAFKIESLAGVDTTTPEAVIAGDYGSFSAIPDTAQTVVNGTAPVSMQVKTQYQVYTAPTQAGGTYNGKVTYTVVDGA